MAAETIVPNVGGGDAGASTSVDTSSSTAATTESTSTSSATEAPAAEITGPTEEESSSAFLLRASKEAAAKAKPAEAVAEPVKPADPLAEPLADAAKEAVKTPEEEAAAKVAEEAAAKEVAEEEEFELEPVGPLPPSELAAKLKEHPELAAAIEKVPGMKENIFAASRLATRVAQYEEIFPDVESAKYSAQAAADFGVLADKFTSIKDADSARGFLQALEPFTYVLGEDGNPALDQAGKPQSDGTVARFADELFGMVLDYQAGVAKKDGDEDLLAAVKTLKARTRGSASAEEEQMTESQKQEAARLKQERESITRERNEAAQNRSKEFEVNVAKDIDSYVISSLDKVLDKAEPKLSDFNRKHLKEEITSELYKLVSARKDFFMQQDALMRRPMSDALRKERLALATRVLAPLLPKVVREKMNAAGVKLQQKAAAKQQQVAAREQQNRSEQRGAGRPAAPAQPLKPDQIHAEAHKEFVAKNGREPSTTEMLIAFGQKKAKLGN